MTSLVLYALVFLAILIISELVVQVAMIVRQTFGRSAEFIMWSVMLLGLLYFVSATIRLT